MSQFITFESLILIPRPLDRGAKSFASVKKNSEENHVVLPIFRLEPSGISHRSCLTQNWETKISPLSTVQLLTDNCVTNIGPLFLMNKHVAANV